MQRRGYRVDLDYQADGKSEQEVTLRSGQDQGPVVEFEAKLPTEPLVRYKVKFTKTAIR